MLAGCKETTAEFPEISSVIPAAFCLVLYL